MSSTSKYINKLANNLILIIGGTSGIGYCVAEASIEYGASVMICGSNPEKLERALNKLRSSYPSSSSNISGHICDLANAAEQETNLRTLLDKTTNGNSTKLNHVVFTAGDSMKHTPLAEAAPDFLANGGTIRFTAVAVSFTFTGGVLAKKPRAGLAFLAAGGSAIDGLARGLAVEMKPLRVNVVASGAVHTELLAENAGEHVEQVLKMYGDSMVTGIIGKPEDVAESYIYLMKDQNVTGYILETNGGYLLM